MTRASRSITVFFALALVLPTFASRPRAVSGRTPDHPRESAWRVVREGGAGMVALSRDGTRLAYIGDRAAVLVGTERGDVLFRSEKGEAPISAVAMSADASKLAVVRMPNPPLWQSAVERVDSNSSGGVTSGIVASTIRAPSPKNVIRPPNQSMGGIGGGGGVITEQGRRAEVLEPPASYAPAGTTPITGGSWLNTLPPPSSSVEVWDVASKAELGATPDDDRPLFAAAFGPDAAELHAIGVDLRRVGIAAGSRAPAEPTAEGRKVAKSRIFRLFDIGPVAMTSFSADGRRAATLRAATFDDRIAIALWKDGDESPTILDRPASVAPQWVISVAPDGERFVTAGAGNQVLIWDFERGAIERTIVNGPEDVPHVAFVKFASDSSRIVTIDAAGTVRVWDGASGRSLFTLKEPVADARDAALVEDRLTIARGGILRYGLAREPLAARTFELTKEAAAPR